jgi:hypothetical protein
MASRKQFHKITIPGVQVIERRGSVIGGKVVGDYIDYGDQCRVLVVEMPKAEVRKAKKKGPVSKLVVDAVTRAQTRPTAEQIQRSNEEVLSS